MIWNWITYENGMCHCVAEEFVNVIKHDMANADPPGNLIRVTAINALFIDLPGMCATERPIEHFDLDGLKLTIPSEDLTDLAKAWADVDPCIVLDQSFYRLCGNYSRCVVVTAEQLDRLLHAIDRRIPAAERRARVFYADRPTPQEILRDHNHSQHGVPKDAPIYGHDRRARHRDPGN